MNTIRDEEIIKARRFCEEPQRIQFNSFEVKFEGEADVHTLNYDHGQWHCSCRFFHDWSDCSHTMAVQRVLGVTIPAAYRHGLPAGMPTSLRKDISAEPNSSTLRTRGIRITEEPLTAQNVSIILTAITELYTKCWLIMKGRSSDLIEFTQTRNPRFTEEANLVIAKVTYNSPFNLEWKLDASPQGLMTALATGIDAIALAPNRHESAELENQAKELSIRLNALEAQSALADKEQARQIVAQKAELEKQASLLEIEKQRLEVIAKRLEVEKQRIDFALEIARNMVNMLRPDADEETKSILMQTLLPNLLQLGNGKGLDLALPIHIREEEMTADD